MEEKEESNEILAVGEEAGNTNFRLHITSVCQSRLFDGLIHLFIALCNVALILENVLQDVPLKEALYEIGHNFFLLVYLTEFTMKVYVHWRDYWRSPSNILSFSVVLALCICACVGIRWQDASILHVFMSLRLLNTLPHQDVLQALIAAYLRATKISIVFFALILEVMLIYAVVGHDLYAAADPDSWGTLSGTLLTLFRLATLDDWTEVQQKLWDDGMSSSWIFTTTFIILVHFLLLRMIFAVYSMSGACVKIKQKTPTNTATQTKLLSLEQESIARELLQGERDVDIQKDMKKLLKKVEESVSVHNKTVVTKSWSTTPEYIAQQILLLKKMYQTRTELQALNSEVLLVLKEMLNLRNLPDGVETSN